MDSRHLRRLIRDGVGRAGCWAELGSGDGNFTLALGELLGPGGFITSVDQDPRALERQRGRLAGAGLDCQVEHRVADFRSPLGLTDLDGVLMANSLHFLRDTAAVLGLVRGYLRPGGSLLIVEYNSDRGNLWVPHPFPFATWEVMARSAGFSDTRLLDTYAGRFLGGMFSALSRRPL